MSVRLKSKSYCQGSRGGGTGGGTLPDCQKYWRHLGFSNAM